MKFSVLMSLYYKENPTFLRQSLDSVINQTLNANEIILVEDGPLTPELYSIVKEYAEKHSEFKVVPLPVNVGLGKALNEGLKYCTNDLVARMDTDDICFHDRFEKQIAFMESNPDVVASSGWVEEFEEDINNVITIKRVPETPYEISKYCGSRNPLNHPAVIFRKKAVVTVGGYQHFPLFEDWYLWARLIANKNKLSNLQFPILYFRTNAEMFKRRGGAVYALNSFKFQIALKKLGLISYPKVIMASIMRGTVYLLPNYLRRIVYIYFLRYK